MAGNAAASVLSRLIQHAIRPRKPQNPRLHHLPPPAAAISSPGSIQLHLDAADLRKAIEILSATASPFPAAVYTRILQLCSAHRALCDVLRVESHIFAFACPSPSIFLLNRVIETYSLCGSAADARQLFDEMPKRDGGTWNAMIAAYTRAECPEEALRLFGNMYKARIRPNDVTLASVLACCGDVFALFLAEQMHGFILKCGLFINVILATSLVDVYGKCWAINDARRIFDSIPKPNDVSWNVIVRRYLEIGMAQDAICMFFQMLRGGLNPMSFTFSNALLACSQVLAFKEGCQIHGIAVKIGCEGGDIVGSSLLDMYAKCGALVDARRLFDQLTFKDVVSWTSMLSGYASHGRLEEAELIFCEMPERNVVSWNAMLAGYVQYYCWDKALDFLQQMQKNAQEMDLVTLRLLLNVCAGISDLDRGKQVHGFAYRHGFSSDIFFSNALVDMYAKCGCLKYAEFWFSNMPLQRDTVSWNSLISGYARHFRSEEALVAFREMLQETIPNKSSFSVVLGACANIFALEHGKQIHGYMMRSIFEIDDVIRGALVDMYCKCRLIDYAVKVFEEKSSLDIVLWNSMMLGSAYNGKGEYGLELFEALRKAGIKADNVTFIGLFLACISEGYVDLGRRYFKLMTEEYDIIARIEHYECMIELLGKHGFMLELEEFIQLMPFEPTVPMWTRILDCSLEHGNKRLAERAAKHVPECSPVTLR